MGRDDEESVEKCVWMCGTEASFQGVKTVSRTYPDTEQGTGHRGVSISIAYIVNSLSAALLSTTCFETDAKHLTKQLTP